jgi:hypothetical protein
MTTQISTEMSAEMSTYEATVTWADDASTRRKVKVTVPDGKLIFPYIISRALDLFNDRRAIQITSLKKLTCDGCIYDANGQEDHMTSGGCLEKWEGSESL